MFVVQYTIMQEGIITLNPFTPKQNDGDGPGIVMKLQQPSV